PDGLIGVDTWRQTHQEVEKAYKDAKFIFINGSPGAFDRYHEFAEGTMENARLAARTCAAGATVIAAGGDASKAMRKVRDQLTHVSSAGSAATEFLGLADG